MVVGEPFDLGHATRYELQAIGADRGFAVVRATLTEVEPDEHRVVTESGGRIGYDRLLLALGARPGSPSSAGSRSASTRTPGASPTACASCAHAAAWCSPSRPRQAGRCRSTSSRC
jgi:NADPH-dependent 2,4-dienoyl-CoA reductase/sulfur reductase-like enzyme